MSVVQETPGRLPFAEGAPKDCRPAYRWTGDMRILRECLNPAMESLQGGNRLWDAILVG